LPELGAFGGLPEELQPENGENRLFELDPRKSAHIVESSTLKKQLRSSEIKQESHWKSFLDLFSTIPSKSNAWFAGRPWSLFRPLVIERISWINKSKQNKKIKKV
jgi:succinylglutamate desuccinylase